ncbi:hypothetical protein HYFRA_00008538 [Hymenoscyphus fraxineus]|uniref:Uncharacterized protein n=1 Tax=Hymenoscyphus fraxineus TaxID=746836 RepID=A0A9N9L0K6_9HELO|nr:hypothetical protein HYFRA_00008538 [Hymenoscyphus fraxineus]
MSSPTSSPTSTCSSSSNLPSTSASSQPSPVGEKGKYVPPQLRKDWNPNKYGDDGKYMDSKPKDIDLKLARVDYGPGWHRERAAYTPVTYPQNHNQNQYLRVPPGGDTRYGFLRELEIPFYAPLAHPDAIEYGLAEKSPMYTPLGYLDPKQAGNGNDMFGAREVLYNFSPVTSEGDKSEYSGDFSCFASAGIENSRMLKFGNVETCPPGYENGAKGPGGDFGYVGKELKEGIFAVDVGFMDYHPTKR